MFFANQCPTQNVSMKILFIWMVQVQHGRHNNNILDLPSIWLTLYLIHTHTLYGMLPYLYNLSQSSDWDKLCSFLIRQIHIFMTFPIIYHITALTIWNLWVGVSSTSTLGVCQKLLVSPLLVVNPCNPLNSGIKHCLWHVSICHIQ